MFPRSNGQWVSRPMPLLQSKVDGTVAQSAVAISIRDVAIDVVGTPLRDVSFPCKELRQAERPREASAVEVAFLPASAREVSRARTATPLIPPSACMATTRDAATAAGGKLTR